MNAQTPQKFTLEEIAERKKKLLNEIHAQKKAMTATTREIFAPLAPATNKADALMRSFNTGMAVFDGVVMGIKIMRKVRAYFKSQQILHFRNKHYSFINKRKNFFFCCVIHIIIITRLTHFKQPRKQTSIFFFQ